MYNKNFKQRYFLFCRDCKVENIITMSSMKGTTRVVEIKENPTIVEK